MAHTNRYCYDCGADATVLLPVGEMDRETGYVDERGYCDEHAPDGPVEPILAPSSSPFFALAADLARRHAEAAVPCYEIRKAMYERTKAAGRGGR